AAADLYLDILAIAPSSPAAHAGLGQALIGLQRLEEAEDQLERALGMDDENVVARLGRARLRLLEGDFPTALEDLEWRWQAPGQTRPEPPGDSWDGGPLDGKGILLWAEQGIDDTIQLARFVPRVAAMGGRVVLAVPAALVPLMRGLDGVAHVVASGDRLPIRVEVNASLFDLPRLFGTSLSTIPADIPYLAPPAPAAIAAPPSALLKVGLAWGNGRRGWSVPFGQLTPLLGLSGVAYFGLQLGPHAKDIAAMAHPALVTDLSPTIGDWADMAARIAEMDVVVTVDGAVAHIAGALGKPVLLMLPFAPDWRWMLEREDSPWYPSIRLVRQDRPDDWLGVVTRVMMDIEARVAAEAGRRAEAMRVHSGPRAALRAMLAGHLLPGDAFVDIGAGDGTFTLDAAAHPSGDVRVLAIEAKRHEADMLADTIAISGAEELVEVVAVPVAGRAMPAVVAKVPRGGRTVFPLPEWVDARTQTVAADSLLADRPHLAERRLIVRIGTKTEEGEVLDGLWEALITHRAAVVLFEHRDGAVAADMLTQAGYRLFRFPSDLAGGPVKPFAGQPGPVLALASGTEPAAAYGDIGDPASPAALATARHDAAQLAAEGTRRMLAGDTGEAARLLTRALAIDPVNVQANTNMGALLRRSGRAEAAAACWQRALAAGAGTGVRANLANVLRELGHGDEAEALFLQILEAEPTNAALLYSLALLERERGRARESLALMERAETLHPSTLPGGEMAVALLKAGNLARGMADMAHRTLPDLPPAPAGAVEWNGERLDARTILVRDEGDVIDTIMLARYVHQVGRQGGLVTVECVPEAARLMETLP
ncbi:MAG TPA: tetratricopeptide repeat protein, partial [Candidatus Omnitrophota bacterium]|nr:tetratricopeptide repeat protein [Candidatus Omnitrophota bacterium]